MEVTYPPVIKKKSIKAEEETKKGYLCISRKPQEDQDTILIDNIIEIKVISIRGNVVRLGIKTDDKIHVCRAECVGKYNK